MGNCGAKHPDKVMNDEVPPDHRPDEMRALKLGVDPSALGVLVHDVYQFKEV